MLDCQLWMGSDGAQLSHSYAWRYTSMCVTCSSRPMLLGNNLREGRGRERQRQRQRQRQRHIINYPFLHSFLTRSHSYSTTTGTSNTLLLLIHLNSTLSPELPLLSYHHQTPPLSLAPAHSLLPLYRPRSSPSPIPSPPTNCRD